MTTRRGFYAGRLLPVFRHEVLNVSQGATRLLLLVTGTVCDDFAKDIGRNNAVSHLELLGIMNVPKSIDPPVWLNLIHKTSGEGKV
jgi:hypothetical protein